MKKCSDYISNLSDYLDGDADPELCREIEAQIGQCPHCKMMLDTLRQTIKICREDGRCEELPKQLSARLSANLRKEWQEKFGNK